MLIKCYADTLQSIILLRAVYHWTESASEKATLYLLVTVDLCFTQTQYGPLTCHWNICNNTFHKNVISFVCSQLYLKRRLQYFFQFFYLHRDGNVNYCRYRCKCEKYLHSVRCRKRIVVVNNNIFINWLFLKNTMWCVSTTRELKRIPWAENFQFW